ncbi:hypothetical protein B0H14DRAFT_2750308 [Mycena olivaceomarginata]|nr:hypothetical protein B0H14DRAFT_2750308 [Mycena olivaceomarginata]
MLSHLPSLVFLYIASPYLGASVRSVDYQSAMLTSRSALGSDSDHIASNLGPSRHSLETCVRVPAEYFNSVASLCIPIVLVVDVKLIRKQEQSDWSQFSKQK